MRIVITGAGGFVGRELVRQLQGHRLIGIDRDLNGASGIEGDFTDPALLARAFEGGCDAVIHLATVPGGAAEADPAAGWRVNMEGAMALAEAAAAHHARFLFASSIAVFGDPLPDRVTDDTPASPKMLYGAHKAMMEQWLATLTRRGQLSALSLRLPGVVARPRSESGMKSAFLSDLFHALKADEAVELPVTSEATVWLLSVERAAACFVHALGIMAEGAVTLPAVRCTIRELVAAVAEAAGVDAGLAVYSPDHQLEAAFGRQPPLETARATALGFAADADLAALVRAAFAHLE